ncbi:hypothetical protein V8C42DRAFT_361877 [Trichoderma barbatum]
MQENDKVIAEVQVDTDELGGSLKMCHFSKVPPPPLYCDTTTCDLDPLSCIEERGEEWVEGPDEDLDDQLLEGEDIGADASFSLHEKRAGPRVFDWLTTAGVVISQRSLSSPSPPLYMRNLRNRLEGISRNWWRMRSQNCDDPAVSPDPLDPDQPAPEGAQVEHVVPVSIHDKPLAGVANHGRQWTPRAIGGQDGRQHIPSGGPTRTPAITNLTFWHEVWNNATGLPAGLRRVTPESPELRRPVDRLYEAIGSNTNPTNFRLLQANLNAVKGRIEAYTAPMSELRVRQRVRAAVDPLESNPHRYIRSFMAPFREVRGIFEYLRDPDIITAEDNIAAKIYTELKLLELQREEARGLSDHWNDFYPHYLYQVSEFTRTWATDQIRYIRSMYDANPRAYNRDEVLRQLDEIEKDIPNWKYPFEDDELLALAPRKFLGSWMQKCQKHTIIWDLCKTCIDKSPGKRRLVSLKETNDVAKGLREKHTALRYISI